MIEKLTKEQEALLPVYRDKWFKIGLSTEPADHRKAESSIDEAYKVAGFDPPIKIWLESPFQGCIGAYILSQMWSQVRNQVLFQVRNQVRDQVGGQVRNQVKDQVWDQVGGQVEGQVRDQVVNQGLLQVKDQVWSQVRDQVKDQVWNQVEGQVWDQVRGQVGDQVGDQVWDQVKDQVEDQVGGQVWNQVLLQVGEQLGGQVNDQIEKQITRCGYGLHDANWLSFYDYFMGVTKLNCCKQLKPLMDLSENCGWWWPFEGAVILTEKPNFICRDEQNRLHHEHRAALEYPDGFGVYSWHGVRVPDWVIKHPESITIDKINKEKNAEVKRVLLERFGVPRWLKEMKATIVQEDRFGKLIETSALSSWEGEEYLAKFVLVKDSSTDRRYALRVPLTVKTAHEGVASTFGLTTEQYNPSQET